MAGAFADVLLAAIGLPPVRASLSPLAEIEVTSAAIAGGDLSRRIDHPSGKTEVGQLALALDTMLATIESAYQARASGEEQAGATAPPSTSGSRQPTATNNSR